MEGISKDELIHLQSSIFARDNDDCAEAKLRMLAVIIDQCRVIQEPWMTLDEFLKSGFIGKCWVNIAFTSYFADFNGIDFVENPCIESKFPVKHITHVMPIHKPELPR